MNVLRIGLGILFTFLAFNVNAQAYFGAGFGNSSWDITDMGLFELEEDTAIRLFGGVKDEGVGFEVSFSFAGYDWEGSNNTHNASNLAFFGMWYLPLGESLDAFGKFGLNMWSTDVDFLGMNFEGDDGFDLAYGLGIDFSASEQSALRVEYEVYTGIDDGVEAGDVTQLMLSFVYFY